MGISRDHWHKRRKTGGKRPQPHKKRKFELGRPAAQTRLGAKRIHTVRTRGGNKKYRALRLDIGNFSWGSEGVAKKTRVIDVMYHPSNNVRISSPPLCLRSFQPCSLRSSSRLGIGTYKNLNKVNNCTNRCCSISTMVRSLLWFTARSQERCEADRSRRSCHQSQAFSQISEEDRHQATSR